MDLGDDGSSPWGGAKPCDGRVAAADASRCALALEFGAKRRQSRPGRFRCAARRRGQALTGAEPLSPKPTASSVPNVSPTVSAAPRSPAGRGPRRRQYGPQPTRLEAVDDPLGPLGASAPLAEAPVPPQKEAAARARSPPASSTASVRSLMDSVNLDDEGEANVAPGPRVPPPVQPPSGSAPPRQTQPSVAVEQAAKPSFHIAVGDPHKVGDLTSSHTEYSVMTKVRCSRVVAPLTN